MPFFSRLQGPPSPPGSSFFGGHYPPFWASTPPAPRAPVVPPRGPIIAFLGLLLPAPNGRVFPPAGPLSVFSTSPRAPSPPWSPAPGLLCPGFGSRLSPRPSAPVVPPLGLLSFFWGLTSPPGFPPFLGLPLVPFSAVGVFPLPRLSPGAAPGFAYGWLVTTVLYVFAEGGPPRPPPKNFFPPVGGLPPG